MVTAFRSLFVVDSTGLLAESRPSVLDWRSVILGGMTPMKPIRWPRPGQDQETLHERLSFWMAHNRDQWIPLIVAASAFLLFYVLALRT
jgi:hypothetical protein